VRHGRPVILFRWTPILGLAALLAIATIIGAGQPLAPAQRTPHVGYVYPAGGKQGETFQVVLGGQFLDGVNEAHLSGKGVTAKVIQYDKPMPPQQAQQLRDKIQELQEKRAAALGLPMPVRPTPAKTGTAPAATSTAAPAPTLTVSATPTATTTAAPTSTAPAVKPTWTPEDDAALADLRKQLSAFVRRPTSQAITEIVTLEVTVAADAEPGHRELRLGMPAGLTNPLVFCIGQLPEFSQPAVKHAPEPTKSAAGREMSITLPAVANGQIMAGGVDRFKFKAKLGQRLVVAASARELMPYLADAVPGWFQATLTLYDAKGNEVAYDDDFRFNPDPVLYYVVPKDGEYTIAIKDAIYRGREDFVYRISVGELPFVTGLFPLGGPAGAPATVVVQGWNLPSVKVTMDATDKTPGVYPISETKDGVTTNRVPFAVDTLPECLEHEPNDLPTAAQAVTLPVIVNGRIDAPGDVDVFRFEGRAGDDIVAEVIARRLGSPLDSTLKVTDAAGKQLAFNDDHEDKGSGLNTHHADSYLRLTLPADGVYYVHLSDAQRQGGQAYAYRLRISAPRPDFELRLAPSSLTVRGGTSAPFTVYALRRDGFAGEIVLNLAGAPAGFTLTPDRIPPDQDEVAVTLRARPLTPRGTVSLQLDGRAAIGGKDVVRPVVPADDMMQAFAYRHLAPAQEWLVAIRPGGGGAGKGKLFPAVTPTRAAVTPTQAAAAPTATSPRPSK
jgi:hypothetical protein